MPNSMDNQDYNEEEYRENQKNKPAGERSSTGPAMGNLPLGSDKEDGKTEAKTHFSSDDLKGKKVDADPTAANDKPTSQQS